MGNFDAEGVVGEGIVGWCLSKGMLVLFLFFVFVLALPLVIGIVGLWDYGIILLFCEMNECDFFGIGIGIGGLFFVFCFFFLFYFFSLEKKKKVAWKLMDDEY